MPKAFFDMYILFDGSVTPCCNIVDDSYYCFGNLINNSKFDDVWNSAEAEKFRNNLKRGTPHALCKKICGLKGK